MANNLELLLQLKQMVKGMSKEGMIDSYDAGDLIVDNQGNF